MELGALKRLMMVFLCSVKISSSCRLHMDVYYDYLLTYQVFNKIGNYVNANRVDREFAVIFLILRQS